MATITKSPSQHAEQRVLLTGVSWAIYEALTSDDGVRGARLTYDRGAMELMSPSQLHEHFAHLIGRFLAVFTEELEIPIMGCRSTTLRDRLSERGLEPDDSYYVQNESRMRGKRELDLEVDPPPDLAIEVEITSSILDKTDIYSTLKVPEVWRFDGKRLRALVLNSRGEYVEQETSLAFPDLDLKSLIEWIDRSETTDETTLVREFREWVRNTFPGKRPA